MAGRMRTSHTHYDIACARLHCGKGKEHRAQAGDQGAPGARPGPKAGRRAAGACWRASWWVAASHMHGH